ncbi:hypothetical protein V6N11_007945 [Hibiscus sabdariffa]|uniref:Uncharacterized protein n=1 Tax=Hibiscus sabdariffa TaxID=183260 RepID=A0ABR2PZM3_9ROSI
MTSSEVPVLPVMQQEGSTPHNVLLLMEETTPSIGNLPLNADLQDPPQSGDFPITMESSGHVNPNPDSACVSEGVAPSGHVQSSGNVDPPGESEAGGSSVVVSMLIARRKCLRECFK